MKNILRHTSIITLLFISTLISAKPAKRGPHTIRQADGSELRVFHHGDESYHWLTNEAGEWIEKQADGRYEVVPAKSAEEINAIRKQSRYYSEQETTGSASPLNIAPRGLILLVSFKDTAFSTPKDEIDSMINGEHYTRQYSYPYGKYTVKVSSEGSARRYFIDQSDSAYIPQFDVKGPYTISKNCQYYGGNNSSGNDQNAEEMVIEACKAALADGVNFSQYDNNGDDKIDFVYVIYAGHGEADSYYENTIWPHSFALSKNYYPRHGGKTSYVYLNGKLLDKYACGNETDYMSGVHDGIGTFCHEFSHVLGLPDIYETNKVGLEHNGKTSGQWDIMDYGPYNNEGNTPPSYSGYERFFFGWATPRVINKAENVTLHELQSSKEVLIVTSTNTHNLIGNDPTPSTFYTIENRQQTGWDTYLPGHGMMLTKIQYSYDKWNANTVNNTKNSYGVDIIEADGIAPDHDESLYDTDYDAYLAYWGKAGDLFPAGATSYTDILGRPITEIEENAGVISFKFMGGVQPTGTEETTAERQKTYKTIENGEIVIVKEGNRYNILGNQL